MANRIDHQKRKLILRMLCEGNSIRSTSRVVGVHKNTVERAIREFGKCAAMFQDDRLRGLNLRHIQVDEQYTYVAKKQARLTVDERRERHDIGEMFLWICLDTDTKLVASYIVGKRSGDMARRLMLDLRKRLIVPRAHESDSHAFAQGKYKIITQISTDGFAAYPEAIDLAFGPYVKYGVLIKEFRNAKMDYDPREMITTKRRSVRGDVDPFSICTSHLERFNCTTRQFMKRFTRLTLGFSKKLECLSAAVSMYLAYYNWVWRTRFPDNSGRSGKLRPTAVMMAKMTDRLWSFDDLYDEVINYG